MRLLAVVCKLVNIVERESHFEITSYVKQHTIGKEKKKIPSEEEEEGKKK